ncbi:MAG: hypothetical protein KKH04_15875 [Proteobacteria bacterium]|nr:hypothetical protein [Pseudomonadota bacterium]
MTVEGFKQLVIRHFERILVGLILLMAFIGTYFIEEKSIILNFYLKIKTLRAWR